MADLKVCQSCGLKVINGLNNSFCIPCVGCVFCRDMVAIDQAATVDTSTTDLIKIRFVLDAMYRRVRGGVSYE